MTLDEILAQIQEEGRSWTLTTEGKIRLAWAGEQTWPVCPLTSLVCSRLGKPTLSTMWLAAARVLELDEEEGFDLVVAADNTLSALRESSGADRFIDLRRRLLAACHLPSEDA